MKNKLGRETIRRWYQQEGFIIQQVSQSVADELSKWIDQQTRKILNTAAEIHYTKKQQRLSGDEIIEAITTITNNQLRTLTNKDVCGKKLSMCLGEYNKIKKENQKLRALIKAQAQILKEAGIPTKQEDDLKLVDYQDWLGEDDIPLQ